MKRFMTCAKNNKGVTLILMALMLAVLIVFASLAIDISYMYFTKNQLQVSADSAALAGAALLHQNVSSSDYLIQSPARNKAIEFASKNTATGQPVQLVTDTSSVTAANTLSNGNDITVGNWNRANSPPYRPGVTPINAIEVKPKKWQGLSGSRGPVRLFLGPVFKALEFLGINADWTFMETSAYAVASRPPRASEFITMCPDFCGACSYPTVCELNPPRIMSTGPNPPYSDKFAWTTLLSNPTSSSKLEDMICQELPFQDVCNENIWSSMGTDQSDLKDFESVFYDPQVDSAYKDKDGTGKVIGWWVIVPIVTSCPPGNQGKAWDPKPVSHYASVRLAAVCATGSAGCIFGQETGGGNKGYDGCDKYTDPDGKKLGNVIVIDRISCIDCDDAIWLGRKPVLVK
jgi:Flp pilus assembly protein TadG